MIRTRSIPDFMRRANAPAFPSTVRIELGTNSLLDLIVFGKHAGLRAAEYANQADFEKLPDDPDRRSTRRI